MIFTIPVVVERTLVVEPTHTSVRFSSHIGRSNGEINGGGLLLMAKFKAQEMSKGIYQAKASARDERDVTMEVHEKFRISKRFTYGCKSIHRENMRSRAHYTTLEVSRPTMLRGAVRVEVWDVVEEEDEINETAGVVEAIEKFWTFVDRL
ncbi:unnamed protein product [Ilex paraguariensis]|uniref:Uncharacterized protein n=1 Tax=Ilex paraguariensis TaxID=185542 RepID=A0ABC8TE99_9AQUA